MIKVTYICDKCRKELKDTEAFELIPAHPDGKMAVPADVAAFFAGKHVCKKCMSYLFRAMPPKLTERKTVLNEEGHREIVPGDHIESPIEKDRKKTYFVSKANYDQIVQLYKDGKEMVEISDELMIAVSAVSKVIHENGLGEERYKGQYIPSHGGSPIPQALPITTKKAAG